MIRKEHREEQNHVPKCMYYLEKGTDRSIGKCFITYIKRSPNIVQWIWVGPQSPTPRFRLVLPTRSEKENDGLKATFRFKIQRLPHFGVNAACMVVIAHFTGSIKHTLWEIELICVRDIRWEHKSWPNAKSMNKGYLRAIISASAEPIQMNMSYILFASLCLHCYMKRRFPIWVVKHYEKIIR